MQQNIFYYNLEHTQVHVLARFLKQCRSRLCSTGIREQHCLSQVNYTHHSASLSEMYRIYHTSILVYLLESQNVKMLTKQFECRILLDFYDFSLLFKMVPFTLSETANVCTLLMFIFSRFKSYTVTLNNQGTKYS